MQNIKFIGNDKSRGIDYDWKYIRKRLKQLGIPKEFYNPAHAPFDKVKWIVEVSERTIGKTTGWLLFSILMWYEYGTVTFYVRSKHTQIAPKNASGIFNVILDNNYISKITDGKYNSIIYKFRKWYLCFINPDTGKVEETAEKHCVRMIALDENNDLRSSANEPTGDIVVFDEFIPLNKQVPPAEFVTLSDFLSTAYRLRESCLTILLANTIDKYNQYFHDLEIADRIAEMETGDRCIHTTDGGTKIFFEIVGTPKPFRAKKRHWTELYLGFKKPEIASITGTATWAIKNFQHIPDCDDIEVIFNKFYIQHNNKLVRFDLVKHPDLGTCLYAHWATTTHNDSIISTREDMTDPRYLYGLPRNVTISKFVIDMLHKHKIYYTANDVGSFVAGYLSQCGISTLYN